MKKTVVITVLLILGIFIFQSCGNNSTSETDTKADSSHSQTHDTMMNKTDQMSNELMTAMHSSMQELKMTDDFDQNFANTMIQHHKEAVAMSEVEVAKGSDAQVKNWAQNIITSQNAEIDHLQQMLQNNKVSGKNEPGDKHKKLKDAMDKMMSDMMGMKMTGNMDKDFVMMMKMHHEGAILMAKDEISYGNNAMLKKMAQKMIDDQSKEIQEFQAWLDKNK